MKKKNLFIALGFACLFAAGGMLTFVSLKNNTAGNGGENVSADGTGQNTGSGDESDSEESEEEAVCSIDFSVESGIYAEEFGLTLKISDKPQVEGSDESGELIYSPAEASLLDGAEIYYTLDGSDPRTSDTAVRYDSEIKITDRSGDANVVSAVSPSLFCTNYGKYSKEDGFTCTLNAPEDSAVDKCSVVRAVVKYADGSFSETKGGTYFVGDIASHIDGIAESTAASGGTLAVISITMNYEDLFDSSTGIYVSGDLFEESWAEYLDSNSKVDTEAARKLDANYNARGSEWEREAHIDMFEVSADSMDVVMTQNCGIRIQGNYSRSDLQKSFRLYAKSKYGESKFCDALFGESCTDAAGDVLDKFDTFILRAGGNCANTAKFNDTFWQTLVAEDDIDISTKCSRPCVVYLNGEYWGLYVMEEDYSEDYFEDHYGVDKDKVVAYKGDAEKYSGGYKLDLGEAPENEGLGYYYKDLKNFLVKYDDLTTQEAYDEFCTLVDPDSVLDYFAVEVWINNKWDWPGKNWTMWRTYEVDESNPYADGRWRFCLYDDEFGGVSGASDATTNTIKEDNYKEQGLLDRGTSNIAVLCYAYLMTNDDFAARFYERLQYLSDNTFEKEHALSTLSDFENIYGPLYDQFYARYPGYGSTENALNGGYASAKCISDFLAKRADYIPKMIEYYTK